MKALNKEKAQLLGTIIPKANLESWHDDDSLALVILSDKMTDFLSDWSTIRLSLIVTDEEALLLSRAVNESSLHNSLSNAEESKLLLMAIELQEGNRASRYVRPPEEKLDVPALAQRNKRPKPKAVIKVGRRG